MYTVKQYQSSDFEVWNQFVATAKNATFLFHRDFMEYHKNRFEDFSLLIYKKNTLVSILPANKVGNQIYSHQGLTYGNLILNYKSKLEEVLLIFREILLFLNQKAISILNLKQTPNIYTIFPSDEVEYISHFLEGQVSEKKLFSVINLSENYKIQTNRIEGVKKGIKNNLRIKEEIHFDTFWNQILIPYLQKQHNTKPVHSLKEIEFLKSKFPSKIRQFNVYDNDKIVGGTTIFETTHVAHTQYISSNPQRQSLGTLDFLFNHLIKNVFKEKKYLDFGTSNLSDKSLSKNLVYWKECFGARSIIQSSYAIETINHKSIESILK